MKRERKTIPLDAFLDLMVSPLDHFEIEPQAMTSLNYDDFDFEASEFIKFAEIDLQQETEHGLVNALSNAKRAIDCQIDTVLGCFGLLSRRNFPDKIKVLGKLGIVTPRIVNKVVKARNYLEHEFVKPKREQIEDAVDVANLFVTILDKGLRNFWGEYKINAVADGLNENGNIFFNDWLNVNYDHEEKYYKLSGVIYSQPPNPEAPEVSLITEATVKSNEKGFFELANLSFSLDKPISDSELSNLAIQFVQLLNPRNP